MLIAALLLFGRISSFRPVRADDGIHTTLGTLRIFLRLWTRAADVVVQPPVRAYSHFMIANSTRHFSPCKIHQALTALLVLAVGLSSTLRGQETYFPLCGESSS